MIEKTDKKEKRLHYFFLYIMAVCCFGAIGFSFYSFFFKKDYNFTVETKCNPEIETCFFRDCENNPDICPPNNLSYYHQYIVKASDFKYCSDDDCAKFCYSHFRRCTKIECTEDQFKDGSCLSPIASNNLN